MSGSSWTSLTFSNVPVWSKIGFWVCWNISACLKASKAFLSQILRLHMSTVGLFDRCKMRVVGSTRSRRLTKFRIFYFDRFRFPRINKLFKTVKRQTYGSNTNASTFWLTSQNFLGSCDQPQVVPSNFKHYFKIKSASLSFKYRSLPSSARLANQTSQCGWLVPLSQYQPPAQAGRKSTF